MNSTTILRSLLATSLLAGLAACGGGAGGGGGGSSDRVVEPPIKNVSASALENRTGASVGETVRFDNAVISGGDTSENFVDRRGTIRFADTSDGQPGAEVTLDSNGNGTIGGADREDSARFTNFNPENNRVMEETGEDLYQYSSRQVGGEAYRRVARIPNFDDRTVIYVPKDEAQKAYAGMYVNAETGGQIPTGATGIWGRKTDFQGRDPFLDAQGGSVEYEGISQASMGRRIVDGGGNLVDQGRFYEGTARATVDLTANTLDARADLSGKRGGSGPNEITMRTSGAYGADGSYNQPAEFEGLAPDRTVPGRANGNFYGPNAESLGMTFRGHDSDARIGGGLVANRTDD